jgi:hypothetical protein
MGRTGFVWLRIGSSDGLLWTWWWTFGFYKESRIFLTGWVTISFSNNVLHHGVSKWISKLILPRSWISSTGTWSVVLTHIYQIFNFTFNVKELGSDNGSTVCISVYLTSLMPYAFNNWQKQFFNLHKILWESASSSPFSLFTKLVLG